MIPRLKKILLIDTGKEWGGGTNSLLELLRRCDKSRYAFTALFYNNYSKGAASDIKTELGKLGVDFRIIDQRPQDAYTKTMKEAVRAFFFLAPALKKKYLFELDFKRRIMPNAAAIASIIKDNGFDLVYMNNQPSSNLEGIIAAHAANVPCLQHARIEVSLNEFEAEAVNTLVSKVICVSGRVADGLVASGVAPDKCIVIHNGIDAALNARRDSQAVRRELAIPDGRLVIGTVGSLVKRKRVGLLIEAAVGIENAVCVIVGDGPERGSLTALAERLGIKDRVRFTGFSSDAVSYINAMDIFVLPSQKEGFPRVILEAMLMGRPVIAFDVAGVNEEIVDGKTGRIIKGGGPQAIADAIREISSGGEDRIRAMGEAGRDRVIKEFEITRYVSGVCGIFDKVLSEQTD